MAAPTIAAARAIDRILIRSSVLHAAIGAGLSRGAPDPPAR
jgi:hypothetical protein